jgi:1,4-dihydroxy-2-naphthoate octaprenyltransferase
MPESKRRKPRKPSRPRQTVATAVKDKPPSPTWYVVTMTALMTVGVLLVLARFVFQLEPLVLIVGLVAIAAGFLMTTNYR